MLAIVLSGGGAKGAYEVGVWKALKKLKIKYQIVTGTSIGAINGFMMVQKDFHRCVKFWKKINYSMLYDNFDKIDNDQDMYLTYFSKLIEGGIDTSKIEKIIDDNYKPNKLYKSNINYGVVACNLINHKIVYATKKTVTKDKLKEYILASATLFPFFKPTKIGNDVMIDGGYVDNLPVNLAIDMGAKEIIAVDLKAIGINKKIKKKDVDITTIKPNNRLDSVFKFDSKAINKMIKLGYNDTLKKFDKFEGKIYTFKKGTISKISLKYKLRIKQICDNIGYNNNFKTNDSIINVIESGLKMFKCDVEKVYNLKRVNSILLEKIENVDMIEFDKFDVNEIKKIFDSTVIAKYIYLKIKKCDKINTIFSFFSKEVALAIYLNAVR